MNIIQKIAIYLIPTLFAITLHEAAHAWAADRLGDKTARMLGRITANPLKHIDPLGTVLLPGLLVMLNGVIFGWAKPVPVAQANLRKPERDMMLVALAGPGANLLMAFFWAFWAKLGLIFSFMGPLELPMVLMGQAGIAVNLFLMLLNLLPLPALDGGRAFSYLLPPKWSYYFDRAEPYGVYILLALIMLTPLIQMILVPPYLALTQLIKSMFFL